MGFSMQYFYLMRREGASLALVGHPSSDSVTIKMLFGVDNLHRPALVVVVVVCTPSFPTGLVKIESGFIYC